MSKVDKLIEKQLNERVGINCGQLEELAQRMEDRAPVYIVDKNGKIRTISYTDPDGDLGIGLYLYAT